MPSDARPPKEWWDKMTKEVSEGNPSYSKDQVDSTVGDIWYHELSDSKRKEIRNRDGSQINYLRMAYKLISK